MKKITLLITTFVCLFLSAGISAQEILDAAQEGNIERVKELIEADPDQVNTKSRGGNTALHFAAMFGYLELAELLIEKNSDVNAVTNRGRIPLHYAVSRYYKEVIELLIDSGSDVNATDSDGSPVLSYTLYIGEISLIELLITKGADINRVSENGNSFLLEAAQFGENEIVSFLLKKNIELPSEGERGSALLEAAVESAHSDLIDRLLEKGVEPVGNSESKNSMLHRAAEIEHQPVIDILLKNGADINSKTSAGSTLLHSAAAGGNLELIENLLERGFNPNERNYFRIAPLHKAAKNGKSKAIELLISRGADINIKTADGTSPYHLAEMNEHQECIDALKNLDADPSSKSFPVLTGPYLGQAPPGMEPELFAPGIISKEDRQEFAGTFSPDGMEFFFTRRSIVADQRVWHTSIKNGRWTEPQLAPFTYDCFEFEPHISPDGKKVFFGSRRPKPGETDMNTTSDIWAAEKTETGWSEPYYLDESINSTSPMYVTTAANGTMYFTNNSKGGIYRSKFVDGKYAEPEALPEEINYLSCAHPYIAPDESYIIFDARQRTNIQAPPDFYISFHLENGSWTKAVNMGDKINSEFGEICASVSSDGKYMFFESAKAGSMNIYWVDAKIIETLRPK